MNCKEQVAASMSAQVCRPSDFAASRSNENQEGENKTSEELSGAMEVGEEDTGDDEPLDLIALE
jgi:hypothetical protein